MVFYDLLPYGVRFDPSAGVKAGRMRGVGESYTGSSSWDTSQITVTVDSREDVIADYRGTGRTMVRFHIHYSGADAAVFGSRQWGEGFGVSFGAYCDWKDAELAKKASNVAAFMSADNRPLLGTAKDVAKDDGSFPAGWEDTSEYEVFGADIDQDGDLTDSVLYARTSVGDDGAQAFVHGVRKLVKADDDLFGNYQQTAEVEPGRNYV